EWKVNVYGQGKSWIDAGLHPRAVTRDLDWGVKVPLKEAEGKVLYVWFDAPIGYISATKDLTPEWEKYWKDKDTRLIHFIGKDNIVFHCIIFPSMLKAEGSYILPDNVPAFEFLNLEGDKISTSRNWAVWLHEYLRDFPNKQDVLRYVLTANAPETKDNDFTWKDFQTKNNSELLAIFGNFVNRTMVLTQKYFDGIVPARGELTELDRETMKEITAIPQRVAVDLDNFKFRDSLSDMMSLARLGNKYLTETEPWKVYKENPERVKTTLNIALQICANMASVCEPFLPFTSEKIFKMVSLEHKMWKDAGDVNLLAEGTRLGTVEMLFDRIEDEAIEKQVDRLIETKKRNEAEKQVEVKPQKPETTFDDFSKIDLRTGVILAAEKVAKANKLLKLTVDTGIDKRIVVSGIAQYFSPEEVIGKQVCILVNLAPRMLKGIESQGMILMAEDADGKLSFVSSVDKIAPGSEIK
ncbi:MAG: methionine--tRNA ligase subunit beta, partial [Bacteroidales bacterium]|nr:methionine--tRNA ligase subunit beta [Bacteroidales bacterium]